MVMHPGRSTAGWNVVPAQSMATSPGYWKQVENGVAVRMAMLYHVCGGELE